MKQNTCYPVLNKLLFIFLLLSGFYGCGNEVPESVVLTVEDEEAVRASDQLINTLSPSLADGLEVSLWASQKLVGDPVALHVDDEGRVLVTVTGRRRNAEIDIRGHRDWMIESTTFETIEDRRDFLRRRLAPERSGENTWLTDHNGDGSHDWRDLTVPQESIFRLEDTTGNGYANRARLFSRGFNEEISDVAGAVLHHQGEVFVGVAPDLWRLHDSDSDGYGEQKESISRGYGVNIGFGGHGMSGLTVGPAGRIYWSIGDRGMSVRGPDGTRWHHPREGVIVRSEPDGSNFEVYASGFRNTHEFVFDRYGNLITVDNDGDHPGESERLVYVVNGSDSGWRLNWQFGKYDDPRNNDYKVWMDEGYFKPRFDDQAAHLLPPLTLYHDGPAGMAYNPGTALSERWADHFFVAEFVGSPTRSAINAFTLKPSGASFELDRDVQVMEGLLATGLAFGPDGALYFADWIEGWALNQRGRIWKLDTPSVAASPARQETGELLARDFTGQTADQLLKWLGHPDQRVRQKAQFELAGRDDTQTFRKVLEDSGHQLKRIHGIWGLAQIARRIPDAAAPLIGLLGDTDSEIRTQAAKMLGDVRYEPAAEALIPLLEDECARVRFYATEALGRLSWHPALQPIVDMLESNDDRDVYLRHGGAIALARIGEGEALADLADHPSRAVRIAAVVALRRIEHPGVARFLGDADEFIVTNAARAINDDAHIEEGLEDLAAMTEQHRFTGEPLMRRAINANLYQGTQAAANRLALLALREDVTEPLKAEALQTLSVWAESSQLDRVTGDPRGRVENNPEEARRAIASIVPGILTEGSTEVKLAGLQAISRLQFSTAEPYVMELLSTDPSPQVRMASLQTLVDLEYENIQEAVFAALKDPEQQVRMNGLSALAALDLSEQAIVDLIKQVLEQGSVVERQTAIGLLGNMSDPAAHDLLESQLQRLIRGELDQEVELELVQAAENSGSPEVKRHLQTYWSEVAGKDSIGTYRAALYGGRSEQGRRLFYRDAAAQCIRCHAVGGEGSGVGPDLSSVGSRLSRKELLRALVDPGARIAPGYGSVALRLKGGETVRGVLSGESETRISVATGAGGETVIDKAAVTERTNSPSGMPAMGEVLTRSQLRDLVEYMTTLQGSED